MTEAVFIGVVARLVEVVHVKLSHERREVVVFEVLRQDPVREFIWLFDYEAISRLVPTDYVIATWVLFAPNLVCNGAYIHYIVGLQ